MQLMGSFSVLKDKLLSFLKRKWSEISQDRFFKNAITLISGAGLAQVLPLLILPIVSRFYHPEDYALLAGYSSIVVILGPLSTGMYHYAIVTDKTERKASNTFCLAFLILASFTVLSAIVIFAFGDHIAKYFNKQISFWLYFIPLTIFFQGFYQILYMWQTRLAKFRVLALSKMVLSGIMAVSTLCFGFFNLGGAGLLISQLIGQSLAMIVLLVPTVRYKGNLVKLVSVSEMTKSLKRHSDFPKFNMPQSFTDGIKESSLIWIISNFFGSTALGSFSFARTVIFGPLQIVGGAVGEVFYQNANAVGEKSELIYLTKKIFLNLCLFGLPLLIIFPFFGDKLFETFFGNKWTNAGAFSGILIFWLYLRFVSSPLSIIPIVLKKQKPYFVIGLMVNFIPILFFYVAGLYGFTVNNALYTFTTVSCITLLFFFVWIYYLLKINNDKY